MSQEMADERKEIVAELTEWGWTPVKLKILKGILPPDTQLENLYEFLYRCRQYNLDPIDKEQIILQARKNKKSGEVLFQHVVGIAGRRILAERTGRYAPGSPTEYKVKEVNGKEVLHSAKAYVKIWHKESDTWHEVAEEAFFEEYVQTMTDYNSGKKTAMGLWAEKPRTMLSKVAETRALRRAFPDIFSGVYDEAEFDKMDSEVSAPEQPAPKKPSADMIKAAQESLAKTKAPEPTTQETGEEQ